MKLEFSKVLAIGVMGIYTLSLATTFIAALVLEKDTTNILNIVQSIVTIVLAGYLGKAGVENFMKIKENPLGLCENATTEETTTEESENKEEQG